MSQLKAGELKFVGTDSLAFVGRFLLRDVMDDMVEFRPAGVEGRGDDAPDYEVYSINGGKAYHLGAAWKKKLRDGTGEFLSITIDCVTWDKQINLAAFPPDKKRDETTWRVQWQRPRQASVAE